MALRNDDLDGFDVDGLDVGGLDLDGLGGRGLGFLPPRRVPGWGEGSGRPDPRRSPVGARRKPSDPPFVRRLPPPPAAPRHLRPVHRWERVRTAVALVAGVVGALVLAWLVLVVLRRPDPVHPSDAVGARVDRLVARTVLADRVLAVAQWFSTASAVLVLGGLLFRALVLGPVRRRVLRGVDPAPQPGDRAWAERRRARRLTSRRYRAEEGVLRRAAAVGIVAGAAGIVLRTATLSDTHVFATLVPSRVGFVATSPFGVATLLRGAGLALV
ncbi:MAG TPA: hypothetical protein VIL36_00705, partial [Acidimicrobiales bacterium]